MDEVNVYGDEWTDGTDEPGFRNRERPPGETLGAQKLGDTIYLIEPGQRIASAGFLRTDGARARLLSREANLECFDGERSE